MLPGFRFVLAAILLSLSILVFGLGAAALLRSAHQQFASIPARQPPPEQIFVQQSDVPLTLALLRVDLAPQDSAPAQISAPIAAPTELASPESAPPVEATGEVVPPSDPPKVDVAAAEPVTQEIQTAPAAQPEAQSAAVPTDPKIENQTLLPADMTLVEPVAASVAPEPAISPPPATTAPEIRVATLGSPAIALADPKAAKAASSKADKKAIKKRALAQREKAEKARRRAALVRARQAAARQKAAVRQPAANPFGVAAVQPRPAR